MHGCRIAIGLAASAVVGLCACSSTTAGTPAADGSTVSSSVSGGSSASTGTGSAAAGAGSAGATTPDGLASTLRRGLSSTRSAHITLRVATGGQTITGSGDETLVAGKLSALSITETLPGAGELQLIQVGGKTYAKLPASLNTSGKPYVLVSTASSDATIRALASSLQSTQSSTSVDAAGVFVAAAQSITNRGTATVSGVEATQYYVVVDVAKLPADYPGGSALTQAGIQTLPITLYVDSSGRPVEVTEQLSISGSSVSTSIDVTKYNQPVTITAPPAGEVSTG